MSAIIDAHEYAADLHASVLEFFSHTDTYKGKNENKFTVEHAMEIFVAMIDDALSSQMRWCRDTDFTDKVLNKHFPWFALFKGSKECEVSHEFYIKVLDRFECKASNLVYNIIPDSTWDTWSLRRLGQCLLIVQGPDYRILDWEKRMSSGEWKR